MPCTLAENPLAGQKSGAVRSLKAVLPRQKKRLVRLRIGVERRPGSVPNGVAVVQLVEQIVYGDSHCQPARRLRELDINHGVRRHETGKAVGLVVVVVLRADVARHSAEAGCRSELPSDSRVRFYARNQRYYVAAYVDAGDSAATKACVGQGNVCEQRDRRENRS